MHVGQRSALFSELLKGRNAELRKDDGAARSEEVGGHQRRAVTARLLRLGKEIHL